MVDPQEGGGGVEVVRSRGVGWKGARRGRRVLRIVGDAVGACISFEARQQDLPPNGGIDYRGLISIGSDVWVAISAHLVQMRNCAKSAAARWQRTPISVRSVVGGERSIGGCQPGWVGWAMREKSLQLVGGSGSPWLPLALCVASDERFAPARAILQLLWS